MCFFWTLNLTKLWHKDSLSLLFLSMLVCCICSLPSCDIADQSSSYPPCFGRAGARVHPWEWGSSQACKLWPMNPSSHPILITFFSPSLFLQIPQCLLLLPVIYLCASPEFSPWDHNQVSAYVLTPKLHDLTPTSHSCLWLWNFCHYSSLLSL